MLRMMGGMLKGLVAGSLFGAAIYYFGLYDSLFGYLGCALTGILVGLICGKAPWKAETIWTPIVKAFFGGLLGAGVFALGSRFVPSIALPLHIQGISAPMLNSAAFLAPCFGFVYGLFIELDDGKEAASI